MDATANSNNKTTDENGNRPTYAPSVVDPPAWADAAKEETGAADHGTWTRHVRSLELTDDGAGVTLSEDQWPDAQGDEPRREANVFVDTPSDGVPITHAYRYAAAIALAADVWENDRPDMPTRGQVDDLARRLHNSATAVFEPHVRPSRRADDRDESKLTPFQIRRRTSLRYTDLSKPDAYRVATVGLLLDIAEALEGARNE